MKKMKKTLHTIKQAWITAGICTSFIGASIQGNSQTLTLVYTGSIQNYTVPVGVNSIRIQANGAKGGDGQLSVVGGMGASMAGDFTVTPGQILKVLIGGQGVAGVDQGEQAGGTGGGGSFVTDILNNPMIIAGGGGGSMGRSGLPENGGSGQITLSGQVGGTNGGAGGTSGSGGITWPWTGWHSGTGGGGLLTNGSASSNGSISYGTTNGPGMAFVNGGAGGVGGSSGRNGGFGGGGAAGFTGGGGGGYSGGGSGTHDSPPTWAGGGGGSYNVGSNQVNLAGINNGNGSVIISVLYGVSITQTSTISCNGLLTAALSASVSGGTGPFTYSWSPTGGTASTATGLGAGSYTCTVSSSVSGTTSSVFTVTQPSAVVSTIASQTNVTCYGGTNGAITLTTTGGTAPYSYTWSPSGGSASTASGLAANTYSCIVKDANNCSATSPSTTITQPATFSVATSNSIICTGETASLTATGATSYTWNTASTSSVIAVSPTVTTTYTVTGMTGVCTNSMTITQNVSVCTGINEALANLISVYPNPNNGVLNITLTNELSKNSSLEVYDALGKLVIKQVLANELNTINISNFENGIYLYKVLNNTNIVKVGKLVKQ